MKEVFSILGESITDDEVNTMIKIAGIKSNDKINFKEFVDFFYKIDWEPVDVHPDWDETKQNTDLKIEHTTLHIQILKRLKLYYLNTYILFSFLISIFGCPIK